MEIEKSLLSQLTTSEAVQQCWDEGLTHVAFEDPRNEQIYDFIINYWLAESMKKAPTEDVLTNQFPGFYLTPSDESLTWMIGKLKRQYKINQLQTLIREVAQDTEDPEAVDKLHQGAWEIKENTEPRQNRVIVYETIEARRDRYLDRFNNRDGGAPIGLEEVDSHTGGILPGEVAIVAAYTKVGKSFLLVNAAVKAAMAAAEAGWVPYVASLEQSIPEFEDRIDALYSGVGYGKLQRGQLEPDELRRLYETQEEMRDNNRKIHLERPERGERTVLNIVNRARQVGANYLIIDQLSWLDAKSRHRDRRDRYEELIYDLKQEVSRTSAGQMPVFMAVQYNRQAVSTKGETGGLHNIANSADIEQTVDIAYGLHRTSEMRANNSMVLKTLGSRRGDLKDWLLAWYLDQESQIFVRQEYSTDDEGGGSEGS